jgi:predicted lipoprotein with Yx(FWY)xxD motif
MSRVVPVAALAAVAVVAALVLLLVSGGSSNTSHAGRQRTASTSGYAAPAQPASKPASKAAVGVRTTPLGRILVDANGRSLYLFEGDKPNRSNCTGACATSWPPLISATTPAGATGIQAAKLGTIAAAGGKRQATYNGHPLYLYAGDQKAGDTTGQGLDQFGAEWYVLSPAGSKIDEG